MELKLGGQLGLGPAYIPGPWRSSAGAFGRAPWPSRLDQMLDVLSEAPTDNNALVFAAKAVAP